MTSRWGANLAAANLDHGRDVGGGGRAAEQVEHVAGEVTLERAQGFAARLAFLAPLGAGKVETTRGRGYERR
jgi:hypothetical protein